MKRLTDGELDILRELERDAGPDPDAGEMTDDEREAILAELAAECPPAEPVPAADADRWLDGIGGDGECPW